MWIFTTANCTGGAALQRSATGGPRGAPGPPWAPEAFFESFLIFCHFGSREAFQGVPGGRSYLLTKYQPKLKHLHPIHHIFEDFSSLFQGLAGRRRAGGRAGGGRFAPAHASLKPLVLAFPASHTHTQRIATPRCGGKRCGRRLWGGHQCFALFTISAEHGFRPTARE